MAAFNENGRPWTRLTLVTHLPETKLGLQPINVFAFLLRWPLSVSVHFTTSHQTLHGHSVVRVITQVCLRILGPVSVSAHHDGGSLSGSESFSTCRPADIIERGIDKRADSFL
jgi:hypothetical protein